jgi:hypothetical protein
MKEKRGSGKKIIWGIGSTLGLLILLVIAGCATTKGAFVNLSGDIYPPKSKAQEVLLTQGDINRPYKEIGLVKAEGNQYTKDAECFDKIRQVAKEAGADAVIRAHVEKTDRLITKQIQVGKFPKTTTFKVKEPVCEGTAVVFTNNGIS